MRVKPYQIQNLLFCSALVVLSGCSTLERIAPPGFVKYEDIAKDIPPNPAIQETIEARKENDDRSFPVLSETPSARAAIPSAQEIAADRERLLGQRDALNAETATDRAKAETELPLELKRLNEQRDALADEVERQRNKAAAERQSKPQ